MKRPSQLLKGLSLSLIFSSLIGVSIAAVQNIPTTTVILDNNLHAVSSASSPAPNPNVLASAGASSSTSNALASNSKATSLNSSVITTGTSPSPNISATALVVPPAPNLNVKGYVLMDATTGQIIASKNMDQHLAPASLTKLMTLYIISNALANKQITLDTLVPISKTAWKTGGSRMFVKAGDQVPVRDLIQGMIVDSGNDATMAMAEFLAGSAESFAPLMNAQAQKLGMVNTHYETPTGLPSPNHYSSPHDLAILTRAIIQQFPEYYSWFKQKTFTYNHITQANRNHLLWRDPSVDGLKTGFTDDAGYCLVSSALRNGTRYISVVMGAPTNNDRYEFSQQLLNYGFRFYQTVHLLNAGVALKQIRTWYGTTSMLPIGVNHDLAINLAIGNHPDIKTIMTLDKLIEAPIRKGEIIGKIDINVNGQIISSEPLIALENIDKGGLFTRVWDGMSLTLHKIF